MIRRLALLLVGLYFLVPLVASFVFTVDGGANVYGQIITAEGFADAFRRSMTLAVLTVAGVLGITIPALLAVHLKLPKWRPVLETLSLIPLAVPPIALVVGVRTLLGYGPDELAGTPVGDVLVSIQDPELPWVLVIVYIVLALPFAYRTLDAGLRGSDVKTLVDAARGLGASWPATLGRVILPQLRPGLLGAAFLTLALVLGEFTVSSILLFETLPVWLLKISGSDAQLSVAVSLASLVFTWLLLLAVSAFDRKEKTS
ncbi:ABC transporter permease [Longispora albida]|uniref:ABC transporter permease n=1 Tax=Longispora albida TaxID=203523 RepID=UPI0003814D72|nr:ABC transporter permease subunit [Longispora albida]